MRLLLALSVAVGLATLPVQQAYACSCVEQTIEEAAARADAVFSGTVVEQRPVGLEPVGALAATAPMPGVMGEVVYTFAVDGVAKGDVGENAQVRSGSDGASCGMTFGVSERWLVFTAWDGAMHTTGLCSGNVLLGADEDPPLPMSAPAPGVAEQSVEIPWPALAVLAAVVIVAGVSLLAFRGGPRSVAS